VIFGVVLNIISKGLSPFLVQFKIHLIVDLMEKPIDARTARLQAMDKIMDKPWKTLRGLPHHTHNFDHSLRQAFLSPNDLYHKLHNNYYFC
jgi:hypothetical protein